MLRSLIQKISGNNDRSRISADAIVYQLVGMPVVFHVLPNQDVGGERRPSLTRLQRDFTVNMTNRLYRIYDKTTKSSVQFANFVAPDQILVHNSFRSNKDCANLDENLYAPFIRNVTDYMFKFHVIVCQSTSFSGRASFPPQYRPTSALHNSVLVDFRALACYNDLDGTFICDQGQNGEQVSHTRWWRTRSTVLAHEFGHLFGLYHTFQDTCDEGDIDGVSDTPILTSSQTDGCPGLLPYNSNRNLYRRKGRFRPNKANNASVCLSSGVGSCRSRSMYGATTTCPACCVPEAGETECTLYTSSTESVSQEETNFPQCCNSVNNRPMDSCKQQPGLDPLNNVMSYIPDFCSHEFTPGQGARMMSQIKQYKPYIYCNYANVLDTATCADVPCAATATSPNCAANK